MSRSTIIRAIVALALTVGGLGFAAPAQAATPGCVTKAEYRHVRKGYSQASVKRIFGTGGKREAYATSGGYTAEIRSYRACSRFSVVAISFGNRRLDAKSAVWSY